MELTKDELMYLKNLIGTSGEKGYSFKIGDMKKPIIVFDLCNKLEKMICQSK